MGISFLRWLRSNDGCSELVPRRCVNFFETLRGVIDGCSAPMSRRLGTSRDAACQLVTVARHPRSRDAAHPVHDSCPSPSQDGTDRDSRPSRAARWARSACRRTWEIRAMAVIVVVENGTQVWRKERQHRQSFPAFSPLPPPSNSTCPVTGLHYYNCTCGNHRCGYCGRRQRDQQPTVRGPSTCHNCSAEPRQTATATGATLGAR